MKQPLLKMENIEAGYGNKAIIEGISLEVQPGEIVGIVGASGCGKSTLLKAVMGLPLKGGKVLSGHIDYKGMNLAEASDEMLRQLHGPEMGMIFQDTAASLCPVRRIEDQIYESVLQHEKVLKQEIKARALSLLKKMNIDDGERLLKCYPFELSGGMSQRVGIMLAMLLKPALLLADEPTSALDVTTQAQVVRELVRMRDLYGTSIILVTHNIGLVQKIADKAAVMYEGRLIEYGAAQEIFEHPQKEYTKQLVSAVLRINRIGVHKRCEG